MPGVANRKVSRHSMNIKRMRGRNHRGGNGGAGAGNGGGQIRHHTGNTPLNRNHVFDSNGPDLRIRGTAQQLFEKYLQLGRDATSSGDRVMAESYFQYAEHYFRILGAMNQAQQGQHIPGPQQNPPREAQVNQPNQGHHQRRQMEQESAEPEQPPGTGDQPSPREIPIAAVSSEA
jgi:hypothetical protein